ncbi:unnamed protein product [Dicrocoelium dendriticum]|nr:unnamed protein product [Dicrocoelium dendriticum]
MHYKTANVTETNNQTTYTSATSDSMSSSCKSRQLSPVPVGTCPPISKASSQGTRSEEYMNAIRQKRRAIEMLNIENEIFRQFSARTMPLMEPSELCEFGIPDNIAS